MLSSSKEIAGVVTEPLTSTAFRERTEWEMMDIKCGLWEEGVLGPGVGASRAS